ncbi:hypothetical protein FKW77_003754 [Venturia effusa]|uniref:Zinc finger PHD-type domain-containing protein n=1 Tax=Venturia effusa TaxID=50376 RepID=A0A517L136_9PEZI|nr:hypothetical protein FKW77_003754 [Venturia effusa]
MPRAAATSPRRSVRARQQPSIAPSQTNSVSSNSSNRAERNTRHSNKPASPQKSSTPQSLSSEEVSEPTRAGNSEPPQPRRSKRQHDVDEDDATKAEDPVEEEVNEDEETTRCMCGQLEYPGPPADAPAGSARGGKNASSTDELSDEISGLFIQCDDCLVWQHGGCVSIMEQSAVPDNYYCEECKPDLHQIFKSTSGQKYSRYLPVWEKTHPKSHRKMSLVKDTIETPKPAGKEKEKEKERAPRTNASASAEPFGKRRSTMNSRAAYDEDEVLRKVLEESKAEGTSVTEGGASRKGKRTRDDSVDVKSDAKRQRTISSPGSLSRSEAGSSDEEGQDAASNKGAKKTPRGAAARSQKEKEQREQRERERVEAANKRKGRADRRRAEDAESEQPEELATKSLSNAKSSPINEKTPETPMPPAPVTSKRGGKRPGAGRGRGNHHATADHESRPTTMSTETTEAGPSNHTPTTNGTGKRGGRKAAQQHHSNEQTTDSDKDVPMTNGSSAAIDGEVNGTGRGPTSDPSNNHTPSTTSKGKEPSMLELKRRAMAMIEYMDRAQLDIARRVQKDAGDAAKKLGLSPAASPSALVAAFSSNGISRDDVPGVGDILHVQGLREQLVGWQAEFGGGTTAAAAAQ